MPCLSIQTNVPLAPDAASALSTVASGILAAELGKPEDYVMVTISSGQAIRFSGTDAPAAFLDLKSIGLPRNLNAIATALTQIMTDHCAIPAERVFIVFNDVPANRWAHQGETFGR